MHVYASAERRAYCVFDFVFEFIYSLKSKSRGMKSSANGTPRRRISISPANFLYCYCLKNTFFFNLPYLKIVFMGDPTSRKAHGYDTVTDDILTPRLKIHKFLKRL